MLKSYKVSEEVCLAGLFHSIYGTEFFCPDLNISRDIVIGLIGEKAERLVHYFSEEKNLEYKIINNILDLDTETQIDLLYIMYANEVEQAHRLSIGLNNAHEFAKIKNKIEELTEVNKNNE